MLSALLIASVLSAPHASAEPANAGPTTFSGKGIRGDATMGGTLVRAANGSASGEFVLYLTPVDDSATACRYVRFGNMQFSGDTVSFNAQGPCTTVTTNGGISHWTGSNAFSFTLGAGNAFDSVDVNFSGASGIAIPGGVLSSGDFFTS
jgi:hypothetical protein